MTRFCFHFLNKCTGRIFFLVCKNISKIGSLQLISEGSMSMRQARLWHTACRFQLKSHWEHLTHREENINKKNAYLRWLLSYFSRCVTKSTSAKLWSNWICVTWRRNGRVGILCDFQSRCIMSESCGLANMCYKRHQRCWYKILQTRSSTLNVVFVVIFHKI